MVIVLVSVFILVVLFVSLICEERNMNRTES